MPLDTRQPVIEGVCPVLETPFSADGEVDEKGFENVIDHVVGLGVGSVMYPGFASEFHKLSDAERLRLTQILLARTAGLEGFRTVISIPDHATFIAVQRARDVAAAGAGAINVLPPHFLAPSSAAVRDHVLAVLEAIAPTPAVVQFAPGQVGNALDCRAITALARRASNLVEVKVESTPPGAAITALGTADPRLPCVVGYAGVQLPDALRRGAVGVQPGCSFVELYLEVWRDWQAGDHAAAEALHRRMLPYLSYWMQGVELIIAAEKEISARKGLISTNYCRGPAHVLDGYELAMIDRFLDEFADRLLL